MPFIRAQDAGLSKQFVGRWRACRSFSVAQTVQYRTCSSSRLKVCNLNPLILMPIPHTFLPFPFAFRSYSDRRHRALGTSAITISHSSRPLCAHDDPRALTICVDDYVESFPAFIGEGRVDPAIASWGNEGSASRKISVGSACC